MDMEKDLQTLTAKRLKALLLRKINVSESEFDEDENLFDYGLDSIDVMVLVGELKAYGIQANFIDMVRAPTFRAWKNLP
ncbi:hypothetical protein JMY81_13020 [Brenneria goodwinii]|uniref:phosphopantetheine-binding protein n=1 Tax=Brenneria goodwinii TaxID=1109412 RepID=UPI000EF204E9|nr:phosphopantetheine-binding protein [Brenneria goodwinii]MCG8157790.1 hypothetical protein [Brenneria goodwinii]MCG8161737.1 hypothetical protein [Brenneria goodwinii]MCG8166629.1 hypothetical protein [Brenneria goodwinii]MCG8171413.1 hypothetical protein [Brenneria goodwinii]MCG8175380.1 hypothetical protein [Brenneria goodwinii]